MLTGNLPLFRTARYKPKVSRSGQLVWVAEVRGETKQELSWHFRPSNFEEAEAKY
jgi:hypothetical protein